MTWFFGVVLCLCALLGFRLVWPRVCSLILNHALYKARIMLTLVYASDRGVEPVVFTRVVWFGLYREAILYVLCEKMKFLYFNGNEYQMTPAGNEYMMRRIELKLFGALGDPF